MKDLKQIKEKLLEIAEDLDENQNRDDRADPAHHAKKIRDCVKDIDVLQTFVNGSGTGNN